MSQKDDNVRFIFRNNIVKPNKVSKVVGDYSGTNRISTVKNVDKRGRIVKIGCNLTRCGALNVSIFGSTRVQSDTASRGSARRCERVCGLKNTGPGYDARQRKKSHCLS